MDYTYLDFHAVKFSWSRLTIVWMPTTKLRGAPSVWVSYGLHRGSAPFYMLPWKASVPLKSNKSHCMKCASREPSVGRPKPLSNFTCHLKSQ